MVETFSITTAIDYINARPHIGHAYEKVNADAIARYKRLRGKDVFFLIGTDEHSANVLRASEEQGVSPQHYCDEMVENYYEFWEKLNISNDDFIRTTEERHIKACGEFYRRVRDAGDIRTGAYEGWYCESCEAFYTDKDLEDGKCPTHQKEPRWLKESNYFFKLSEYEKRLLALYEERPEFICPETRRNEVVSFVKSGLEDFSTSRATFKWGIPIPDDPSHVIYVWFDALINYMSGMGYAGETEKYEKYWPADLHSIGKDIIRFHCVYWPAMLMSAGFALPKTVFAHGFVLDGEGRKMSKSLGNVVDPIAHVDRYGLDAVRYYLMREAPYGSDLRYSEDGLIRRNNADLANDLGNLLGRTISMVIKYRDGMPPRPQDPDEVSPLVKAFRDKIFAVIAGYRDSMDRYALQQALIGTWEIISAANRLIDESQPWALRKDPAKAGELDGVLGELIYSLEVTALLTAPFMPDKSAEMFDRLGRTEMDVHWRDETIEVVPRSEGQVVQQGPSLFPRIETAPAE